MKKFKVSFEIEGNMLADGENLNKSNIVWLLRDVLEQDIQTMYGNRYLDCSLKDINVEELK
jgi:hypothetical protein